MVQADLANLVSIATSGTKTLVSPTTAANALASYMLLAGIDTKKGLKSIANLSISPSSMNIAIGLSHQLTVSSVFSDGTSQTVDNTQIQFVSSNINIVTVSKTGIINAMGPGSAEVSITFGGVSIKATVTVPQGVLPGGFSGQVFT
jgi:uncharacterized protein YjdB